jgi:hypothetical protein
VTSARKGMLSVGPVAIMDIADPQRQLEILWETPMAGYISLYSRHVDAILSVLTPAC